MVRSNTGKATQFNERWVSIPLAVLICAVYLPFLGAPFFFDDLTFFSQAIAEHYSEFHLELRWVAYATLGWTAALFSDEFSYPFRLGNLLIHAANSVLLLHLLRQIFMAVHPAWQDTSRLNKALWFAVLLFALHPVAAFAVGYVVQRSILLATLFMLLMQLAFVRGLLSGEKRWLALSVAAFLLACFSKEHSVLAPLVLLALMVLLRKDMRASGRVLLPTGLAFLAVMLLVTLKAQGVLGQPYEPMAAALFAQQGIEGDPLLLHLLSALTQAELFFKYLLLWILPDPSLMSIDMRESLISDALAGSFALLAFVGYGVAALRLLWSGGGKGLLGFALLYPWLLFLVELAGIRVQEPFVLYRSYLWMPGFVLLAVTGVLSLTEKKIKWAIVLAVLLLLPLSWQRLWVFADDYRLWNEAATLLSNERVPGADRIYYNRGQAAMKRKQWEQAALDFERSAAISPQLEPVRYSLGLAYASAGRTDEAMREFDVALQLKDDDARVYYARAMLLSRLHRREEARAQLQKSCDLKNTFACLVLAAPPPAGADHK